MQRTSHDTHGQMLIEALVAMSILVVAILGIFTLISRSVSLNRVVADQYVGSYLAAEGIEIVKNIIDSNVLRCDPWNQNGTGQVLDGSGGPYEASYVDTTLHPANGAPLLFDPASGFYQYDIGNKTPFYRTIIIQNPTSTEIDVGSKVSWEGRSHATSSVELEDHFYNWRDCTAN